MRSISLASSLLIAAVQYGAAQAASQTQSIGVEQPSSAPVLNNQVVQGCFSSAGSLVFNSTQLYNSLSKCAHDICYVMGKKVAGTTAGNQCYCGDTYPPKADVVDDSNCNVGCTGYNLNACGGVGFWTIYNTGIDLSVAYDDGSDGASSSASPTAVVTVSGSVVVVTQTSPPGSGGGSANTAGIAAGVVVAVVAVAGIIGAFFFVLRRRRNREIEEEHRRNAAVNAFINGQKPPSSSGGFSITDARLDPVMAQRRMSDGSIADNQDYSRRILRVTNA